MVKRTWAIPAGVVLAIAGSLLFAAPRRLRVTPDKSDGSVIPSGGGGNIPGRTSRDSSVSCGQCHGAQNYGNDPANALTVTIAGPNSLNAGNSGAYTIKTVSPNLEQTKFTGIDVASSNFAGLSTADGSAQLVGNEITHKAPAKALSVAASTGYSFSYQMPGGLAPGSARTLYGVSAVGFGFGWNFSPNFNVIVPVTASTPASPSYTAGATNINLAWSGDAAAYWIVRKQGGIPTTAIDGITTVVSGTSKTISGLTPLTQYGFRIYATSEKLPGPENAPDARPLSTNHAEILASTTDYPPSTFPLLRTGSMGTARFGHTATPLANGKVLIAGGQNALNPLQSAELYDPVSGTFSSTGSMAVARSGHTATPLPNGKVLITGGSAASAVAELYDPVSGTFSNTGAMATTRSGHTATLLNNGKVLIAGGSSTVTAADLYDPTAGTFSPTLNMTAMRFFHTATLLTNGKVLLAGGSATVSGSPTNTAEVYDPAGTSFSATGNNLAVARKNHTATALILADSGLVSLVGGIDTAGNSINSTETYDSSSNTFTTNTTGPYATAKHTTTLLPYVGTLLITGGRASNGSSLDTMRSEFTATLILSEPRAGHTATLLPDGRVLIAGGSDTSGNPISSADLYDPNLERRYYPNTVMGAFFGTSNNMGTAHAGHTATLLPNGKVLIAGGFGCASEGQSAELYDPDLHAFTATGNLVVARARQAATLLPNGKVLLTAGEDSCSSQPLSSAELYDPGNQTFTATGNLPSARSLHTATLLANGKVLIAGGRPAVGFSSVAQAVLYDPDSGTFAATGTMSTPRENHTATLLPNGKVLIAGGNDETNTLYTAELYNPNSGTFSASNSTVFYQTAREGHLATLLPNGKVLVADGKVTGGGGYSSIFSALLYDPASDDYGLVGCCLPQNNGGRVNGTATVLPDGRVLMIGGFNENGRLATAEVYDATFDGTWQLHDHNPFPETGDMATARESHTATLLPDGSVLVAGGIGPGGTNLNSAEVFSLSRAPNATRPVISSAPATTFLPAAITISGTGLRANWEASSGTGQGSPSDLPLLRLQRVDNGQILFLTPSTRDATVLTSTVQSGLADGHYRATIVSDAVPSLHKLIAIRTVLLVGPASVSATATTATSVALTWSAVNGAANYEILRTDDNVNYTSRGAVAGTSFADSAQSGKAYLYKVHALDALGNIGPDSTPDLATTVIFDDDPVVAGSTPARAAHITQLRTAVNAVRTLAGMTGGSFAETITAGSTTIKASHILELRSALTPARSTLGLLGVNYSDSSLDSGFLIRAVHINELRSGVK